MKKRISSYFRKYPALGYAATLVFFILVEGLYSFCTYPRARPIDCPGFNDPNYDAWFQYQEGQTIRFLSSQGRKDSVTLVRAFKSPAYTGTGSCDASAQVRSAEIFDFNAKLDLSYHYGNYGNMLYLTVLGFNANTYLQADNLVPVPGSIASGTFQNSATINGKTFSNVVLLQRDTTTAYKPTGAYKIWLAKGMGVVGYEMYSNREIWVKE